MTTTLNLPQTARLLVLGFIAITGTFFALSPNFAFAASASFDTETLTSTKEKPKLSGEADLKSVRILIENEDGKRLFRSKELKVRDDAWKVTVTKKLKPGNYEATILDGKGKTEIASSSLTILDKNAKSSTAKKGGALSVSALPLLVGGNALPNASVPVAYIKVANPSKEIAYIDGFTLKQNGSANTDSVIGFATSDDKGGSRATITDPKLFKNGSAFVPLKTEVAPGQVRIFTIKALVNGNGAQAGKQLMLDVASINTGAKLTAVFPLRGVTWNLVR